MRTFNEYVQEKDTLEPLATILLENGIDVEEFSQLFLELATENKDEEVILNELLNTIANMGRGAMNAIRGAFGSVGQSAGQGMNRLGQGAAQLGNKVASGAQALGQKAMQAPGMAGKAIAKSAQPVVNSYMQGSQSGQIKQAIGTLQNLHQQLTSMKFVNPEVNHMFQRIFLTLQKGAENLKSNSASRFGVGENPVWQRPTIPYAQAVKSQVDPLAATA